MTEDDIDFLGVKTDAAAAAFAGGQFDCVGVFAPFTRPGARAGGLARAVQLGGLPRRIPDHLVATADAVDGAPEDDAEAGRRLVRDARLDRGQPRRGDDDHGREGRAVAPRSTRTSPRARRSSPPSRRSTPSATGPTTRRRCPRWPGGSTRSSSSPGLTEKEADLDGPLHARVHRRPTSRARRVDRRGAGGGRARQRRRRPPRRRRRGGRRGRRGRPIRRDRRHAGRRQHPLLRIRSPLGTRLAHRPRRRSACSALFAFWVVLSARLDGATSFLVPSPAATWDAFTAMVGDGTLRVDLVASLQPRRHRLRHLGGDRHRARHRDRHLRVGRGVLRAADRVPALHPGQRAHAAVPAVARASARARRSR